MLNDNQDSAKKRLSQILINYSVEKKWNITHFLTKLQVAYTDCTFTVYASG